MANWVTCYITQARLNTATRSNNALKYTKDTGNHVGRSGWLGHREEQLDKVIQAKETSINVLRENAVSCEDPAAV